MKFRNRNYYAFIICTAFLTTAYVHFSGMDVFAAKGYKGALKTSESLQKTKENIEEALEQLDKTMMPLNELTEETGDLRKGYKKFSKELEDLQDMAADIRAQATEMYGRGLSYFEKWEKESENIQSETIRQRSAERRTKMMVKYEKIQEYMQQSKGAFTPLMANLQDIDVYLSSDLNINSVASINDLIAQANNDAMKVKENVAKVLNALQVLALEISPDVKM